MAHRIKVLHLITRLIIGGAQENTVYTVLGLCERGKYEADLASGPTAGPEGSMEEEIRSQGITIISIPFLRRNINPVYDFLAFLHIFFIIKKGRYDIVHTHSSKAGFLGRLAAKLAGVKSVIHTIHGLPFHPYQSRIRNFVYKICERLTARFTRKIIAVSKAMVEQAVRGGVAEKEKFAVIYSGLELAKFSPRNGTGYLKKQFGIAPNEIVIGKVARLFHLKGHSYLFRAVSNIIPDFPNLKILLVGDGILRRELEKEAEALGLKDRVIFTGLVGRDRISDMIALMDIVAHCSLREGLARVIPQTMAMKKPVVAFNLDGSREVIENGVNGFLVKAEDGEELSSALKKLLNNPSLISEMGASGRKRIEPHFDKNYMVSQIETIYENCKI
jgi:glycosyltransferase involved in cell wall biosynthesis